VVDFLQLWILTKARFTANSSVAGKAIKDECAALFNVTDGVKRWFV
jgi:hypothetical protein